jgi:uncharacterized protein YcbK (DUF882 family)
MPHRLGLALLVVSIASGRAAAQGEPGEDEAPSGDSGDEAERPEEPPADASAATPAAPAKRKKKRRKGVNGHVVHEDRLRKRLPPPPSGNLYLFRTVEKESLKVNIFNPDGSYNVDAIKSASHMLRCRRTDTERSMEPRLLAVLSHVFDHFGERRIDVVSGYRNQRKTTSYHYKGSAADIRIEGVPAAKLKAFVETLDAGGMGIGIYPVTGFVHIDVRPPPSYRWIDYAKSNPDAQQKKPPPWFKKKRLQS